MATPHQSGHFFWSQKGGWNRGSSSVFETGPTKKMFHVDKGTVHTMLVCASYCLWPYVSNHISIDNGQIAVWLCYIPELDCRVPSSSRSNSKLASSAFVDGTIQQPILQHPQAFSRQFGAHLDHIPWFQQFLFIIL